MTASETPTHLVRGTRAVKSVSFHYRSSPELPELFEDFRLMCNEAVRIALVAKPRNRFSLIALAYPKLKEYGLHSHYIHSACEVAYSAYSNKSRRSVPYFGRAFLKLDNESYGLNHLVVRIPTSPRHFIFLTLEGSNYHLSFVDDLNLRRGSVTITGRAVTIAFSKAASTLESFGNLGIDINERNVTVTAPKGFEKKFDGLAEVVEIKERYREIRSRIGRSKKRDRRIRAVLLAKYGKRERNRTALRIHKITREIVNYARENRLGIKMENLKGIRRHFKKGSSQGPSFRGRMNSWVFGEAQRQILYKSAWLGVPVYQVNPRDSSSNCPVCGSRVAPLQERKLYCLRCGKTWDRDDLASKNIMACAVPQAPPPRRSSEREPRTQEGAGNPLSRWAEVGLDDH